MSYFWVTDSSIYSICTRPVNLGIESVETFFRRFTVHAPTILVLILCPVVVPLLNIPSYFSSQPMKNRRNSLVRRRTLFVSTSGMYTMYTCHSNEVSPPFHDPVSSQFRCERSTQSHDEWSRGHRFGRLLYYSSIDFIKFSLGERCSVVYIYLPELRE